ncbi:Putative ribonuclease H protein, partial [Glycine soja]
IKSVLTSIPIYFLSFFRVPKAVVDRLVKIQRRFMWGGAADQAKIPWISWEVVCLPKEKEGLGIEDINNFNLALLGKWKWNLMQNQGELWTRVLESKYGGWRGLMDANSAAHESIWWRDL